MDSVLAIFDSTRTLGVGIRGIPGQFAVPATGAKIAVIVAIAATGHRFVRPANLRY
jgi:hypothetical protein